MKKIVDGFLLSFSYFSIIPIRISDFKESDEMYRMMIFTFPLVGLILGLISSGSFLVLSEIFAPIYAAFLSAVIYILLYGFLHLEAVSDVIDGWFASYSNKDVYEVMKDPRTGAVGAVGTSVITLLKIVAISYLFYSDRIEFFLMAIILSRYAMLFGFYLFSFHEDSFLAKRLKSNVTPLILFLATIFYLSFIYLVLDLGVFINTFFAIVLTIILLKILKDRLGFLNGDCMGATITIVELILLNIGLGA